MFKKTLTILLFIVLILSVAVPVGASESFSRADVPGGQTDIRLSRNMYEPIKTLTAASLGLGESLTGITDIYSQDDGSILVLCGDESRLVRIFADLSGAEEILVTDAEGQEVNFKGAKGVFYNGKGSIYIADTANSRILVTDINGKIEKIMETPDSELIPENFVYQPSTVAIDNQGFTYILSLGCYYGALLYSPEGTFLGFYGANTSNASALDTLSFLWDKLTRTEAKKASSIKKLPFSFVDFAFDTEGYMVTCTGNTSNTHFESLYDNGTGQIRKISHNGSNILYKRSIKGESQSSSSVNFLESRITLKKIQDLVAIDVSDDNYIFALDKTYGLIYIYDSECNLMASFGGGYGKGEQAGIFQFPVSMTLYGDKLFVADSENLCITVFESTHYGDILRKAQNLYISGDYADAENYWKEILSLNRNCQLAYRGMAMAHYNKGEYATALEEARIAMDYSVYEMAWQQIVTSFVAKNFIWISLIILFVVGGIAYLIIYFKKSNKKLIKNAKLKLALSVSFHPFESYRALKFKKMGSLPIAIAITVLFYVGSVLKVTAPGFLYSTTLLKNYNSLYTLGSTAGLLILWSVSNWLVCTMFSGKGTLKEVYTATSYALIPLVVYTFIEVVLSKFLPYSCEGLLSGIETALLIYTVFLVIIAMIEVHEYDFFKVILTGIVIVFFMILVVFILLMCAILFKQFVSFIGSIYEEIAFR